MLVFEFCSTSGIVASIPRGMCCDERLVGDFIRNSHTLRKRRQSLKHVFVARCLSIWRIYIDSSNGYSGKILWCQSLAAAATAATTATCFCWCCIGHYEYYYWFYQVLPARSPFTVTITINITTASTNTSTIPTIIVMTTTTTTTNTTTIPYLLWLPLLWLLL